MRILDINLKPEQVEAVEHLCKGEDVMLTLPTGTFLKINLSLELYSLVNCQGD